MGNFLSQGFTLNIVGDPPHDAKLNILVNPGDTFNIISGFTYNIKVWFNGLPYNSQFTADKNNFVSSGFPLTGTGTYNANGNTLFYKGFVANACP